MYWETKRKLLYGFSVAVIIIGSSVFLLKDTLFPAPTCVDRKQNGYESGVDCGGTCALKCTQDVSPLTVVWSKAVRSGKDVYDLVALVANSNIDNASRELGYTFTIYDDRGSVLGELSGSTTAPLDGKFPLIIQNVPLKMAPSNVVATVMDGPHFSVAESPTSPTVKIASKRFEAGSISRIYAIVINTKRIEINNLPVRVLLYDDKNNVYAVGQTIIPFLPKEGIKQVVVTWGQQIPVPTRIEVYPIFNPFDAIGY